MLSSTEFTKFIEGFSSQRVNDAYKPEIDDLYFLYTSARQTSAVAILEFGSGWSTLALALALHENFLDFGETHIKSVRHPNPFKLLTIDASEHWQNLAISRLPKELADKTQHLTLVPKLIELRGVVCHIYENLPNFTPDLVYLDGPDDNQVVGNQNGFEFGDRFTTPMAADLIRIEPYFWPETRIIVDGRSANSRFLKSNFVRNWEFFQDRFGDRTIFRLNESPFGQISEDHINLRLLQSRSLVSKEFPQYDR